jgi:hypothetical protein
MKGQPPLASRRAKLDRGSPIKTVDLKADMPTVSEALLRLDRALALARKENVAILKIVHGYGSSGVGGAIRIAVQKRLQEFSQSGHVRVCIFGENWTKSNEKTWQLVQAKPELKHDPDLGRRNRGITIVVL